MTNFSIDPDSMKSVVAKAILDSISESNRDTLISEALTYLIAPTKDSYGRTQSDSPLQMAFNHAIRDAACEVVKELISQPDYAERIDNAIRDAVAKSLSDSAGLSSAIGFAVSDVIEKRIREWA